MKLFKCFISHVTTDNGYMWNRQFTVSREIIIENVGKINKYLANAKRPCDCSMLCLRPKVHCAVVRIVFQISHYSAPLTACAALARTKFICQRTKGLTMAGYQQRPKPIKAGRQKNLKNKKIKINTKKHNTATITSSQHRSQRISQIKYSYITILSVK